MKAGLAGTSITGESICSATKSPVPLWLISLSQFLRHAISGSLESSLESFRPGNGPFSLTSLIGSKSRTRQSQAKGPATCSERHSVGVLYSLVLASPYTGVPASHCTLSLKKVRCLLISSSSISFSLFVYKWWSVELTPDTCSATGRQQ